MRDRSRWCSRVYDLDTLTGDPHFVQALRRSVEDASPPPLLRDAKIKITSRCNLRCQMCNYWRNKSEDALSTAQWMDVLDQLAELGCRKVHFSGGEVFLRRDFLSIVEHGTGMGLKINMTTNGTLIDKAAARRIVDAGVNSVSISLDGPSARVHDRIRGQDGAFKKSLRTIRLLQQQSARRERRPIKIRINFVIMNDNFRVLPAMTQLAAELGAVDINPMPVDEKGERVRRLTAHQIETFNREIAPEVLELRRAAGFPLHEHKIYPFGVSPRDIRFSKRGEYARGYFEKNTCLVPWLHMFIAWNGDVYLCCMTNRNMDPLGNVRDAGVRGVFHGEAYRRIRQAFVAHEHLAPCRSCDLFPSENARLNRLVQLSR